MDHNIEVLQSLASSFILIPIQPKLKIPLQMSWSRQDLRPPFGAIQKHIESGGNVGLRLDNLIVIDIDIRAKRKDVITDCENALSAFLLDHLTGSETLTSISGSGMGGRHLIYRATHHVNIAKTVAQSEAVTPENQHEWSIALYAGHKHQIVLPPSIHPSGRGYAFVDSNAQILDAPDSWLAFETLQVSSSPEGFEAGSHISMMDLLSPRVRGIIESGLESYTDRDKAFYEITSDAKRAGFTKEQTLSLYLDPRYNLSQKGIEKRGPDGASDWIWKYSICNVWDKTTSQSAQEVFAQVVPIPQSPPTNVLNLTPATVTTLPPKRKYLTHIDELGDPEDDNALVEGLFKNNSFSVLVGEPNVGKSFAAISLGLAISRGTQFLGRDTEQGAVVYLALEGLGGIKARIKAYKTHHDLPHTTSLPFHLWEYPVLFGEKPDSLKLLLQELKSIQNLKLIIVDTLARSLDGDENSAKDMGHFIKAMDTLKDKLNTAILVIHHTGKSKNGPRGSSALFGAIDSCIEMTENRFMSPTKQRDMAKTGKSILYGLKTINLGVDKKGRALESCVIILESEKTATTSEQAFVPSVKLEEAKADASKPLARALRAYEVVKDRIQAVDDSYDGLSVGYEQWRVELEDALLEECGALKDNALRKQVSLSVSAFKGWARLKTSGSGEKKWYIKK